MALSTSNLPCKLKIGRISDYSVGVLRLIRLFLNVTFKISDYHDAMKSSIKMGEEELEKEDRFEELKEDLPQPILIECLGSNYQNIARKTF